MSSRAFRKYFLDINTYNFPISFVFGFLLGYVYGLLIFCSIGILIGFWGFKYFNENQYYMYYNLGWTKFTLLKQVFIMNLISALILFSIVLIIA